MFVYFPLYKLRIQLSHFINFRSRYYTQFLRLILKVRELDPEVILILLVCHYLQVIRLLKGEEKDLNCPKQILRRTYSEELLDAENYNSTKYLVHRPQRIALVS